MPDQLMPYDSVSGSSDDVDVQAIYEYAKKLEADGDSSGAEACFRRAAGLDDLGSIEMLAFMLGQRGEIGEAESWFRRGAELGSVYCISGLGRSLNRRGDLEGAEVWLRQAAELGDADSMNSLGKSCRDRDDPVNAEIWFRRSASLDHIGAIENLSALLLDRGDDDEAERWLLIGAGHESHYSLIALGNIALDNDELAVAEDWYRKAVSCGDTESLVTVGKICQNRGDFGEATTWFRRAIDEGIELGTPMMTALELAVESLADLNRVIFTTFDWQPFVHEANVRAWRREESVLAQRYLELAPDFESWDAASIRSDMLEFQDYVESPYFDVSDLEVPEILQSVDFRKQMTGMNVLDVECFEIQSARCVYSLTRHRVEDAVHYSAAIFILFDSCFWILGMEVEEQELVGAREGAVARTVMNQNASGVLDNLRFNPYEIKWDGMIPIEDDPLTRIRMMVQELRQSIRLDESLVDLAPFRPDDD